MRVLIVYASRHGGAAGIADRLAEVLRTREVDVAVADAADQPDAGGFDAHVVGSGVYIGNWLKEGVEFLDRNRALLATRPVWLYSSGPLQASSEANDDADLLELALGPADGPGSGGRKRIAELSAVIHPRGHRVFGGAFDPNDPPKSMQERMVRLMPPARKVLIEGDFRDWGAIDAWAGEIADDLAAALPVAAVATSS